MTSRQLYLAPALLVLGAVLGVVAIAALSPRATFGLGVTALACILGGLVAADSSKPRRHL